MVSRVLILIQRNSQLLLLARSVRESTCLRAMLPRSSSIRRLLIALVQPRPLRRRGPSIPTAFAQDVVYLREGELVEVRRSGFKAGFGGVGGAFNFLDWLGRAWDD